MYSYRLFIQSINIKKQPSYGLYFHLKIEVLNE